MQAQAGRQAGGTDPAQRARLYRGDLHLTRAASHPKAVLSREFTSSARWLQGKAEST